MLKIKIKQKNVEQNRYSLNKTFNLAEHALRNAKSDKKLQ